MGCAAHGNGKFHFPFIAHLLHYIETIRIGKCQCLCLGVCRYVTHRPCSVAVQPNQVGNKQCGKVCQCAGVGVIDGTERHLPIHVQQVVLFALKSTLVHILSFVILGHFGQFIHGVRLAVHRYGIAQGKRQRCGGLYVHRHRIVGV